MLGTILPRLPMSTNQQPEDRDHAWLSCSGYDKWFNCPGSPKAEDPYPSTTSAAAAEGTCAHALLEYSLLFDITPTEVMQYFGQSKELVLVTDGMIDHITQVKAEILKQPGKLLVEKRVNPGRVIGLDPHLLWGTSDIVIIDDGLIHIADLKYGKSPVPVKKNYQLILYALGASELYDFSSELKVYQMTIYQPRVKPEPKTISYPSAEMAEFAVLLKEKALATLDDNAPRIAGSHCFWCKARPDCFEYRKDKLKAFNAPMDDPDAWDELQIASVADLVG